LDNKILGTMTDLRFLPTAKYKSVVHFIVDKACLTVLFHMERHLHLSNKVHTGNCWGSIKNKSQWGEWGDPCMQPQVGRRN